MKNEIEIFLKKFGVYKVGIASPNQGFDEAEKGCHPKEIMENCNSVVVFAFHVGLDYYAALDYCDEGDAESRIFNIYRDWISYRLASFLNDRGYEAVFPIGFKSEKEKIARLSFKLAAYEAGLGVFGRPSIIITPEYGPRVNLGAVLTNASMETNKPLKDFNPCQGCDVCVKLCPVDAISKRLAPPKGFNRDRCVEFIDQIREKTKKRIRLCGFCYNYCPVGRRSKKTFSFGKWRTLLDLSEGERNRLLQSLNVAENEFVQ
jgi:epoxyqueuosine reductase QueG